MIVTADEALGEINDLAQLAFTSAQRAGAVQEWAKKIRQQLAQAQIKAHPSLDSLIERMKETEINLNLAELEMRLARGNIVSFRDGKI